MPGFVVQTLAITGKWVPQDGEHRLLSLFGASVNSFAARLKNQRSRIVEWPSGAVVAEMPPRGVHVTPRDIWRMTPALRKLRLVK
jgi:hypothetical protein